MPMKTEVRSRKPELEESKSGSLSKSKKYKRMNLQKKFWVFSIACILTLPAALFGLAFFLYPQLPEGVRSAAQKSLLEHLPLILTVCLLTLMALLILISEIFHHFILPLNNIKEVLRLITAVKSPYRLTPRGSKDLRELADAVNKAAELIGALQEKQAQQEPARRDKTAGDERDILAGLLSDIPGGIVAANADGRIFLYTRTAADLVDRMQTAGRGPVSDPPVGLDRSIFSVFAEALGLPEHAATPPEGGAAGLWFSRHGIQGRLIKIGAGKTMQAYYLAFLKPEEAAGEAGASGSKAAADGAEEAKKPAGLPHCDLALLHKRKRLAADIRERELARLTYTVFDLETTGLNAAGGDEILSIGAVRIVNGRILFDETFYEMVNPDTYIPQASTKIHGIAGDMLDGQPGIDAVMPDFCRYFEDSVLVCHCADLDCRFLAAYTRKAGIEISNPILDTFDLSRLVQPSETDHSLESIARRLGTRVYDRHIAYGDAWTTAEILLKLISVLAAREITTLRQVQESCLYYLSDVKTPKAK